jgi:DNA-binding LytR/AlgR family response regulator
MPEISVFSVAESIQKMAVKPLIIFVTSHDELVYDSLMLHPFGFVRKSHVDAELKKVLKDAEEEVASREKHFFFHTASGDVKLKLEDILYFESEGNYIKVITAEEEYRFRETMQTLEMSLSSDGFVRIHKGFLLNQGSVKMIKTDAVILYNDVQLPFGRSYLESARKKLMRGMIR